MLSRFVWEPKRKRKKRQFLLLKRAPFLETEKLQSQLWKWELETGHDWCGDIYFLKPWARKIKNTTSLKGCAATIIMEDNIIQSCYSSRRETPQHGRCWQMFTNPVSFSFRQVMIWVSGPLKPPVLTSDPCYRWVAALCYLMLKQEPSGINPKHQLGLSN